MRLHPTTPKRPPSDSLSCLAGSLTWSLNVGEELVAEHLARR